MSAASPTCGVLVVDKPAGITSHDVVDRVRRLAGMKKVGHGGTLDPFATGLLLVLLGKATRLFDYLAPLEKEYRATACFGAVSVTGDVDGEISPVAGKVSRRQLEDTLPRFTGRLRQQVPLYSAVKIGGVPLHRRVRRGEQVDPPWREIHIRSLRLDGFDEQLQQAELTITCSGGTYIRKLCEDLGKAMGTGAYTLALRRTAVGEFTTGNAASLAELAALPRQSLLGDANPAFISCCGALYFLPVRELSEKELQAVSYGRPIEGTEPGPVKLVVGDRLVAVYGPGETEESIYPRVIFL
ncbi:tRNA pseudouridine synthase B [bacterium BMS3Abin01]|nr:tRNA pseudouridine synthase B [bacterium BMS3Abin01]